MKTPDQIIDDFTAACTPDEAIETISELVATYFKYHIEKNSLAPTEAQQKATRAIRQMLDDIKQTY